MLRVSAAERLGASIRPADEAGRRGREADPVPAAADHLAERADREALLVLGQRDVATRSRIAERRRLALAGQAHDERALARPTRPRAPRRRRARSREARRRTDSDRAGSSSKAGVEERLEVQRAGGPRRSPRRGAATAGCGAAGPRQCLARPPSPAARPTARAPSGARRGASAWRRAPRPRRVSVRTASATSRPSLIPTPAKPIPSPRVLRAGGEVVIARQLAPAHAGAVVHHDERLLRRVGEDADVERARVERVGHDLGEDRLLDRVGIGVAQVLEQVLEIDARLAHRGRSIPRAAAAPGTEAARVG